MKISKFSILKKYEPFSDYSWDNLIDSEFQKRNIIHGENGAGKTALIAVIKDLSESELFDRDLPSEAKLLVDGNEYTFSNGSWDKDRLDPEKLLIFDSKYVRNNIHIHGVRPGTQGEVKQNATKLLISLSEKALELSRKTSAARDKQKRLSDSCRPYLGQILTTDEEKRMFSFYKKHSSKDIEHVLGERRDFSKGLIDKKETLEERNNSYQDISDGSLYGQLICVPMIIPFSEFNLFFTSNLKKKTEKKAHKHIYEKIISDQEFFSKAFEKILEDESSCPICDQPLKNVLEAYKAYFDKTYEEELEKLKEKSTHLNANLSEIQTFCQKTPKFIQDTITNVLEVKTKLKIFKQVNIEDLKKDVLQVENEVFTEIFKKIDKHIEHKKTDFNQEDYDKINEELNRQIQALVSFSKKITPLFLELNKLKKESSSPDDLTKSIEQIDEILELCNKEIEFLDSSRINQEIVRVSIQKRIEKVRKKHEFWKNKHAKFLSSDLHKIQLGRMQKVVNEVFKLRLTLEEVSLSRRDNIEIPFDFEIQKDGKSIKFENLSEGERQILSLAFFFATLDEVNNKGDKILIFDDPVTSMDSRNLKLLTQLIDEKTTDFSQLFIFTHHDLFYKYLSKGINASGFGIIKSSFPSTVGNSTKTLLSSCIYKQKDLDLTNVLGELQTELSQQLANGTFNYELFILKYGQYLRLAVEDLIKHKLLHWKNKDFIQVIDKLKAANRPSDTNLEELKAIYNFCNWSNTSHIDKEEITSYSELKVHIDDFISIYNQLR